MRTYKLVAHRGASACEPENTLRAIKKAIDLKVDMVEVDVRSTADRHLVVIHDPKVDRTTNGKGNVKDMTLRAVNRLDAGRGEKIPTLEEVVNLTRDTVGLMLEIKGIGIEKRVADLLRQENLLDQVVVTSFMSDAILKVKENEPRISTGQIFSWRIPDIASKALNLRVGYMVPEYTLVTREMTRQLHEASIQVFPWTVDDRHLAERLIADQVDGIITNVPDLMLSLA